MRDGPPEVNDLKAVLQQFRGLVRGKMPVDTGDGSFGRLVNVGLGGRLSLLGGVLNLVWTAAADRFR